MATLYFDYKKFISAGTLMLYHTKSSKCKSVPPLIAKVPTVIMSIAAVKVKNATPSRAEEFPFITHHTAVCTNKS